MHELEQLCREIDMPQAMTARLRSVEPERRFTAGLCDPDGYEQATERLRLALGDDPDGVKILAAMSVAAAHTRQMYRDRDIPPSVFTDTMRCFSRFVREYAESFGRYGFDRWFWTGRQLSCTLFRLGALEYETVVENGSKMLSLHIPSDADLSDRSVEDSLRLAKTFFDTYERSYVSVPIVCSSWLLSPALAALLPPDVLPGVSRFAKPTPTIPAISSGYSKTRRSRRRTLPKRLRYSGMPSAWFLRAAKSERQKASCAAKLAKSLAAFCVPSQPKTV